LQGANLSIIGGHQTACAQSLFIESIGIKFNVDVH